MGPLKSKPTWYFHRGTSFPEHSEKQNLGLPISAIVLGDVDLGASWVTDERNPLKTGNRKRHGVNRALALCRVIIPAVRGGNLPRDLGHLHRVNASLVIAPECQSHLMCVFQPR